MLLKSIKLTNFRQFKSGLIEFSTDEKQNITLITGEMGFGKTTLEQAFRFVLYGKSEFYNDVLVNSTAQEKCCIGDNISTEVTLEFKYKDNNYILTRKQTYTKTSYEKVNLVKVEVKAIEVDKRGNSTPLGPIDALNIVEQLIPVDLADYFFIDGEKIEKMTKSIKEVSKQEDFIKVVKSMLGLNYMFETVKHLERVKSQFTKELSKLGGEESIEIERKLSDIDSQITNLKEDMDSLNNQQESYKCKAEELDEIIQLIPNAQVFQARYKHLNEIILTLRKDIQNSKIELFRTDRSYAFYIASPLMKKAINLLAKESIEDRGIPNLHSSTIDFILESQKCLCGNHIENDSEGYKQLKGLLKQVPPQSIASSVTEFKKIIKANSDYFSITKELLYSAAGKIASKKEQLNKAIEERDMLSRQIENIEKAVLAKQNYDFYMNQYNGIFRKLGMKSQEIVFLENTKRSLESEFQKMSYRIDAGNKFRKYINYTEELTRRLSLQLKEKEDKVREQLESQMNQLLALAYKDGFKVTVDDKYKIRVHIVQSVFGETLDKSTGQWLTIIFAFIASVMQLAKENSIKEDPKYFAEYPLVLDAPFSTIDEKYVEKISDLLRNTSRQVILFMNVTATKVFLSTSEKYVGRKYNLKSNNSVETFIEEEVKNVR